MKCIVNVLNLFLSKQHFPYWNVDKEIKIQGKMLCLQEFKPDALLEELDKYYITSFWVA